MKRAEFYPLVLRTDPPTVVTREMVEEYFRKRGKVVRVLHIPATAPREERAG